MAESATSFGGSFVSSVGASFAPAREVGTLPPPDSLPSPEREESPCEVRRRFFLPVIAPGLLQGKSGAVVTPMLPIFVKVDLHGSNSEVGLVASAYPMAAFCSSAMVGVLLKHMRYSVSSCLALCVLICTALLSFCSTSVTMLFCIRIVGGVAMGAWDLSRKAYIAKEVPNRVRGRIASTLAGAQKLAVMVAAILSGYFAQYVRTRSVFLVQIGFTGTALMFLLIHEARTTFRGASHLLEGTAEAGSASGGRNGRASGNGTARANLSLHMVLRQHWRDLVGAGAFCAMLSGCRNTWQIALPLQGHNIGLTKSGIGLAVAWVRAVEACVTLTAAGQIMDRHGRKAGTMPALLLMACGFALLPMARSGLALHLAGTLYGLGNGLSGGIIVYFSTSLAPAHARTQFLGLWKTVTALGGFILPPLFGFVADWAKSLETATMMIAFVAVLSVVWLGVFVTEKAPVDNQSLRQSCADNRPLAELPAAGTLVSPASS